MVVDSLYSPRQESQQYEAINHRIQDVIEREVEQLYAECEGVSFIPR